MFNLNQFVMSTIKGMIGNLPDYKAQEYALGWYNRGTITENDLSEINTLIENKALVTEISEEVTENENTVETEQE